ncbi:MAG: hypothetical protein HQ463_00925 [Bacteroidetes bacterium]|nr:hypothetical protein [Bacteroidota bacterium]
MFKWFCFTGFYAVFFQMIICKNKDTTNNYRLKGVDITIGGGEYKYGSKQV